MAARTRRLARPEERELVLTRLFDAPRELVFQAWTAPEHAKEWWGPAALEIVLMEMDVRPGGAWRKCMRAPDGREFWRHGTYREVMPPERLVFTYFSDDPHSHPEHEMLVTVLFEELGSQTRLTLRQTELESAAARDSHRAGWASTLERLAVHLERA
jgi:uncharacterized protein YndB with AHSA1/START domain